MQKANTSVTAWNMFWFLSKTMSSREQDPPPHFGAPAGGETARDVMVFVRVSNSFLCPLRADIPLSQPCVRDSVDDVDSVNIVDATDTTNVFGNQDCGIGVVQLWNWHGNNRGISTVLTIMELPQCAPLLLHNCGIGTATIVELPRR